MLDSEKPQKQADSRCGGRNSNPLSPEHKIEALPLEPSRPVPEMNMLP